VIMPPIGKLMGGVDFSNLFINLSRESYDSLAAAKEAGAATINYGVFGNTVLDFLIIAVAIFMMIKQVNRLKKAPAPAPAAAPTTRDCPHCLMSVPILASRCGHCTSTLGKS